MILDENNSIYFISFNIIWNRDGDLRVVFTLFIMKLFISPHSDDAVLFGAFTLMREKPLVLTVTDSFIQSNRGDDITWEQRRQEDISAMQILGCSIIFGGLRDDIIDEWGVNHLLEKFANFDTIYAPAVQGGNPQHDLIGKIAKEVFGDKVKQYSTYANGEWFTTGTEEVTGDHELKNKALECYRSQINLPATAPHFEGAGGRPEWFI